MDEGYKAKSKEASAEAPKQNKYEHAGATVEMRGQIRVEKLSGATPEGMTDIGSEKDEYKIEIPVGITDPNAQGDFKGEMRWSTYVLTYDNLSDEVTWSSRVDRRFDEKEGTYKNDGPTYQIHADEVAKIMEMGEVAETIAGIKKYSA